MARQILQYDHRKFRKVHVFLLLLLFCILLVTQEQKDLQKILFLM